MSGPFGSTPHNLFNTTSASFYNGVINQSLRFEEGGTHYLDFTPAQDGTDNKRYTISVWLKLAQGSSDFRTVFSSKNAGSGTGQGHNTYAFGTDDQFETYTENGANNPYTTALYRDRGSWYNFVIAYDTTQSTASDRIKIYVNGSRDTTLGGSSFPGENSVMSSVNTNGRSQQIGKYVPGYTRYFNGYMADFHMIDGQALDASYFGETKNGIWIPIAYADNGVTSHGINGYHLTFQGTGTSTTSQGTTAQTNIGDDQSGNGNNFAVYNLAAGDIVPDSPEHNFPVMNSICDAGSAQSIFAFTEGNLKIRNTANNYSQAITTQSARTGKWYYECYINEAGYPSWQIGWMVGRQNGLGENEFPTNAGAANAEQKSFTGLGYFTGSTVYISDWGEGSVYSQQIAYSGLHSAGDAPTTGDIIGVAADFDNRKFYFHINGEYIDVGSGTGNPSTGANPSSTYTASEAPDDAEKYPWVLGYGTSSFIMNFGQDGTFAGNKTAQGNADENGIGNFFYSVPTGFLAFTSKNFSDTTLSPNGTEQATDHYQTALYEGTGSSQNVTGVGFQPDWVWVKRRDGTQESSVTDSVRGVNAQLRPAATAIESSQTDCLTSFDSDGFTLGADASGNNSYNYYTDSHVAWCWKAGGAPTATNSAGAGNVPTAGSVIIDGVASTSSLAGTIAATKISANTKAGFSIVTYTGTGSNATVAHGLTSAPDVCIVKERGGTGNWFVYSRAENDQASDEAHVGYFNLSTSAFVASAAIFNDTPPTDTVFHLGTGNSNSSTDTYVAYLFHEVEGFSKFGYFAGNSSSDGTFVYCGFKPARIWLRQDATGIDWTSYDLKRLGYNVDNNSLRDKTAGQEQTDDDIDILSNGFKCRRNFANNQGDVLFFAWADSPVKYSNAR